MTSPKLWPKTRAHRVFRPFGRFLGTWADSTHSTAAEVEGFGSWRFRIQDFGVLIAVLPQKLDDDLLAGDGHLMPFDVICGVICVRHFKRANHSKPSYKPSSFHDLLKEKIQRKSPCTHPMDYCLLRQRTLISW